MNKTQAWAFLLSVMREGGPQHPATPSSTAQDKKGEALVETMLAAGWNPRGLTSYKTMDFAHDAEAINFGEDEQIQPLLAKYPVAKELRALLQEVFENVQDTRWPLTGYPA
jgi:hypothetical protein